MILVYPFIMLSLSTEKQLKNLGLNSYEVKIWVALLAKGSSTAGQLSNISNVPRSRSYDVLTSLQNKGFVEKLKGKPLKYAAIPPNEAIEKTKIRIEKNTKENTKLLNDLKNTSTSNELNRLYNQNLKLIEASAASTIKGRQNIHSHIEHMLKKAERKVLISTTKKEFSEFISKLTEIFEKLKEKKVAVSILTQVDESIREQVDKVKNYADVIHSKNKARYYITDGKEILFMINDDDDVHAVFDIGVLAKTPFARDIETIFSRE